MVVRRELYVKCHESFVADVNGFVGETEKEREKRWYRFKNYTAKGFSWVVRVVLFPFPSAAKAVREAVRLVSLQSSAPGIRGALARAAESHMTVTLAFGEVTIKINVPENSGVQLSL